MVKNPPANVGDIREADSIPGSGRSPGEGNGNPLQDSCLRMHGQRSLASCSPCGHKELDTTEAIKYTHTHMHTYVLEKPKRKKNAEE